MLIIQMNLTVVYKTSQMLFRKTVSYCWKYQKQILFTSFSTKNNVVDNEVNKARVKFLLNI